MELVRFAYANRDVAYRQVQNNGKAVWAEYYHDLDANGVPQNCWFEVGAPVPAPPSPEPDAFMQYYNGMQEVIEG